MVSQLTYPAWDAARRTCLLQAPAVTDQELQDSLAWSWPPCTASAGRSRCNPRRPACPWGPPRRVSTCREYQHSALRVYARREGVATRTMDCCLARDVAAVQRQLMLWPLRHDRYPGTIRNPAGLLTAALQEDWRLPDRADPPR